MKKIMDTIGVLLASILYGEIKCKIWVLTIISTMLILLGMGIMSFANCKDEPEDITPVVTTEVREIVEKTTVPETTSYIDETEEYVVTTTVPETTTQPEKTNVALSDIELIALLTMAEAEGESEEGKRLVIDTVLNRVDHSYWPNTVRGVIYQSGQFTSMWNGRVNKCYVSEEYCQLVREEIKNRTNSEVVYFRTDYYSNYGQPMFQVGSHYFSSYS